MPRKSVRQASKEALKQMQLLSQSYGENEDDPPDDPMDPTETFEITSDEENESDAPPKKKYKTYRKGDVQDLPDREVPVVTKPPAAAKPPVNRSNAELLTLDAWIEDLSDVQKAARIKLEQEYKELTAKIEQVTKSAEVIFQGEIHSAFELENSIPPLVYTTPDAKKKVNAAVKTKTTPTQSLLQLQTNKSSNAASSYQLVMDPRLGLIVGTMTPTTQSTPALPTQASPSSSSPGTAQARQTRQRGKSVGTPSPILQQNTPPPKITKVTSQRTSSPAVTARATETPAITITPKSKSGKPLSNVVDLTSEENASRPQADSREVSFNKLQGKTFPSLVVVARPHLSVRDISGGDRTKLDAKVKSVLMYVPTKFTEWLIQQGLVRSEQVCVNHPSTKLKLGMYSDVSKFPYSGGYVWISECCPTRFVSVFSGSLFEGSSHPPSVILKLVYHWACQTNVQNVVQWVKVDNLYVKGINTLLRGICSSALHTHVLPLGGGGKRVEVGVISLGTTTQDGLQRQVKVEVLGVLESERKRVRLRAIEPLAEADRNYKKRFAKILEPLNEWVLKDSIIVTDLTVDKQTLLTLGFTNIQQSTSSDAQNGNQTIMEYLRRIVPRMFQNTLSLLSKQIIQQFLDELVWREWYGTTAAQCFDNILLHIAEQTRTELATGESLIIRLNKVAANPFKNWSFKAAPEKVTNTKSGTNLPLQEQTQNDVSAKKTLNRSTKRILNTSTSDRTSPEPMIRSISPDVPEQMVPLENYYYGTIEALEINTNVKMSWNMKCSMCKSHYSNNIKLMGHLFTHAHNVSGNVFQCQYCLSSVGSQEGLEKHIITSHPVETKFMDGFVCIICEQRFANSFSLGKHLSKEHVPAELPYNCGSCAFRCSSHRQAIDHFYNSHDKGNSIQCPFCLKSTTIISSGRILSQNLNFFLQHLQKHQKKALARKCPKCALWFINKDTLREHQTNMHLSQRRKSGLVSWPAPRHGTMVPKSKSDIQVWEDSEREVDISNISINNLPNKLLCKECKSVLKSTGHFESLGGCPNQNCQFETCCKNAMKNHTEICKDLNSSLPIFTLSKEMFCVCGYSDNDGNTLAKHLAQCERKSAYPSAEIAKKAIKTHSMLDVLGLVRRPEEPLKSPPVVDLIELDDDKDANQENEVSRAKGENEDQNKEERKTTKKVNKKKKKAEEEVIPQSKGDEVNVVQEDTHKNEVNQVEHENEDDDKKTSTRIRRKKRKAEEEDTLQQHEEDKVSLIQDASKQKEQSQTKGENEQTTKRLGRRKKKNDEDEENSEISLVQDNSNQEQIVQDKADRVSTRTSRRKRKAEDDEIKVISEEKTTKEAIKKKRKVEDIGNEVSEKRKKVVAKNNASTMKTRTRQSKEAESDDSNDVQIIENEETMPSEADTSQDDAEMEDSEIPHKQITDEERDLQTDEIQNEDDQDSNRMEEVDEIELQLEALERGEVYNTFKTANKSQHNEASDDDVNETSNENSQDIVEVSSDHDTPVSEFLNSDMPEDNAAVIAKDATQSTSPEVENMATENIDIDAVEIDESNDVELPKELETITVTDEAQEVEKDVAEVANQLKDTDQEVCHTEKQFAEEHLESTETEKESDSEVIQIETESSQECQDEPEIECSPQDALLSQESQDKPEIECSLHDAQLSQESQDEPEIECSPQDALLSQESQDKPEIECSLQDALLSQESQDKPEIECSLQDAQLSQESQDEPEIEHSPQKVYTASESPELEPEEALQSAKEVELQQQIAEIISETEGIEQKIDDKEHDLGNTNQSENSQDVYMDAENGEPEETQAETDVAGRAYDDIAGVETGYKELENEVEEIQAETDKVDEAFEEICDDIVEVEREQKEPEQHTRESPIEEDEAIEIHDDEAIELHDDEPIEIHNNEAIEIHDNDDDEAIEIHDDDDDGHTKHLEEALQETDEAYLQHTEKLPEVEADSEHQGETEPEFETAEHTDQNENPKEAIESEPEPEILENIEPKIPDEAKITEVVGESESLQETEETKTLYEEVEEIEPEPETLHERDAEILEDVLVGETESQPAAPHEPEKDSEYVDDVPELDQFNPDHQTNEIESLELRNDNEDDSLNEQNLLPDNHEVIDKHVSNIEETDRCNELVNNSIDDAEENIEKELFSYPEKQTDLIDKDAMDVDLPDIFEELGQSNAIGENVIDNTAFDSPMVVDNPCFDSGMTGIEPDDDNTKMLEEFIESIQTDAL